MSMEPSWVVPCDSGWSMEDAAAAWSSDHRISFQTSLPSGSDSGMQLQVVEYAAPATPTHDTCTDQDQVLKEVVQAFNADYLDIMEKKMHRFPPSLVDVDGRYKVPVTVAIGPYHHGHPGRLEAERVKHVAASQCVTDSGLSLQELYSVVCSVSDDARSLYYHNEAAGKYMGNDDFLPMMFFDGCFLVQFMRWYYPDRDMHEALDSYFYAHFERISTDIMMLENQIPWVVVQAIFNLMPPAASPWLSPWEQFVIKMRSGMKNREVSNIDSDDIVVDPTYKPPHLLGLVRFYIVGSEDDRPDFKIHEDMPMSLSISMAELADIGIELNPKGMQAGLVDMRFSTKPWCFIEFGDLVLPPLYLTEANATWLVNMAAFELCKTPHFGEVNPDLVRDKDSAVCSYIHLFAMLLDREQHVHELQKKLVIDGGGLTSTEALEYFTSIGKNMRLGTFYLDIITQIEIFKKMRSRRLRSYLFLKKYRTTIAAVFSIIVAVVGILSSLQALKPR
ncbi:hypothetical protein CFC21_004831 [Triticum aestivum]|uniref:Uncharacterized protein n=2 Tax=Triticum aestivum TaxID=4565 RepID=A0A9R1IN90_WHEAT|nr:uncharacterized protein LOC123084225 [Triticum aestivum]KAF6987165.1 hypothetical protein CFC21_004831 [Triticum aestivum]